MISREMRIENLGEKKYLCFKGNSYGYKMEEKRGGII